MITLAEIEAAVNRLPGSQQETLLTALAGRLGRGRQTKPFDFDRTLAAAAALPDLSPEEFTAFENDMNRPLLPTEIGCD